MYSVINIIIRSNYGRSVTIHQFTAMMLDLGPMKAKLHIGLALTIIFLLLSSGFSYADLGEPFTISGLDDQSDSDPAAAFDSVNNRWFVVWKESSSLFLGAGRIMGRFVSSTGTVIGTPVAISGSSSDGQMSAPRIAYDPIRNEFLVVWVAAGDPIEPPIPPRVHARRILASGVPPLGTDPAILSAGGSGEGNPDVAVGFTQSGTNPPEPYFLVVWEDTRTGARRIWGINVEADDSDTVTGIRLSDSGPFTLDDTAELPGAHESFKPRIARDAPTFEIPSSPGLEQTAHQ
ncbi:MAG: hypothetical protein L0Y56_01565, partial [Nitrospira sp.]|nr:hypothetical protein [Nitrospira sp.]